MAAKQGFEDSLIQTLGHWKSAVYLAYYPKTGAGSGHPSPVGRPDDPI